MRSWSRGLSLYIILYILSGCAQQPSIRDRREAVWLVRVKCWAKVDAFQQHFYRGQDDGDFIPVAPLCNYLYPMPQEKAYPL